MKKLDDDTIIALGVFGLIAIIVICSTLVMIFS